MQLVERHSLIEENLDAWAGALGAAREAYRGHAYRVHNFARFFLGRQGFDDELATASVFHDLGIWSDRSFDYLPPSLARADEFLRKRRPDLDPHVVLDAIANHHLLRRARLGGSPDVVEAFRRADLADVSVGLLSGNLDPGFARAVRERFPYQGFHGILVSAAAKWWLRHPLRPLPMLRLMEQRADTRLRAPGSG